MAPGNIPKRLAGMKEMIQLLILPERQSERRYKRHVKIKMSGYKRNPGRPASKTVKSKGKVLRGREWPSRSIQGVRLARRDEAVYCCYTTRSNEGSRDVLAA